MPALALTDHGVMYGVIEFYQKAKKAGIKPIIGVEGYVAKNILNNDYNGAREAALRYEKIFGKGNFFLEVQNHPTIPEQELVNEKIFALSKELGIGVIATNDSHYP